MAVYSNPKYATTDSEGKFTVTGLEFGTHDIYYVPGKTLNEVQAMSKSQIEGVSGVVKGSINTTSIPSTIELSNGYEISGITKTKLIRNEHIKAVYRYNESGSGTGTSYTGCLGGTEAGCSNIVSTVTENTTYNKGDIVKYEVSNGVEKYFNVLYDKGDKLIMQQRENTVYNTAWYTVNDNTKGPLTILPALEAATSSWTNVNSQTYTAGSTTFGTGSFASSNTSCIDVYEDGRYPNGSICTTNQYTMSTRTQKARMITVQEAGEMGCKIWVSNDSSNRSCKKFMNNYLSSSTSNGGTFTSTDTSYWTLSKSASYDYFAWYIGGFGAAASNPYSTSQKGARAVVEINK